MIDDTATEAAYVTPCGPERADDVHRLTQVAFHPHRLLDPPSSAGRESVDHVRDDLAAGGGGIAEINGRAVGCLRWAVQPKHDLYVSKVAVEPALQGRGLGRVLMAWAEEEALRQNCASLSVGVRVALPDNIAFFHSLGYIAEEKHRHDGYNYTTYYTMRKHLTSA